MTTPATGPQRGTFFRILGAALMLASFGLAFYIRRNSTLAVTWPEVALFVMGLLSMLALIRPAVAIKIVDAIIAYFGRIGMGAGL